jgi:hypothetical protein
LVKACVHACIKENYTDKAKGHLNHQDLYLVIIKKKRILLASPNVETLLDLFLSVIVMNCSGEKLKHIKNEQWKTILQEKHNVHLK